MKKTERTHIIRPMTSGVGKILPAVLIAFILLLGTSVSHASEASYERHIAKGVSDMESGDFRGAIEEFKAALKDKPEDRTATLYLGIAYSRSGSREAEATLKKAHQMDPSDSRANLELGISYFNIATYAEARSYFENAIKLAPGTELSAKAEEYLSRMREAGVARRWSVNASVGMQYDTNVILDPGVGPLPQGITGKSDWSGVIYLKGRYKVFSADSVESTVGYSLYQNLHTRLTDFNLSDHILDLNTTYRILPWLSVRGIYAFDYAFVGGNGYDLAHSIAPAVIIAEGKGFSTTIEYRYRKDHFFNSDLFSDNSDRNGSDNLIEISQDIPVHRLVTAHVAYSYDVDSTRKDFWHYTGNKVTAGLRVTLPCRIFANIDGEYYDQDYKGISPFSTSGISRKDRIYTASVSATKLLSDRYAITVGQQYIRDKSNIAEFDYKRALTSLFLNVRF